MSGKINSHIFLMLSFYEVFIKWSDVASKEIIYYKIQQGLKF